MNRMQMKSDCSNVKPRSVFGVYTVCTEVQLCNLNDRIYKELLDSKDFYLPGTNIQLSLVNILNKLQLSPGGGGSTC